MLYVYRLPIFSLLNNVNPLHTMPLYASKTKGRGGSLAVLFPRHQGNRCWATRHPEVPALPFSVEQTGFAARQAAQLLCKPGSFHAATFLIVRSSHRVTVAI